jgi:hypothetical protein
MKTLLPLLLLAACASTPESKKSPMAVISVGPYETFKEAEQACQKQGLRLATTDEAFAALMAKTAGDVDSSETAETLTPKAVWDVSTDPKKLELARQDDSIVFAPGELDAIREHSTLPEFREMLQAQEDYAPETDSLLNWGLTTFCAP